jgi:hypothetical protein
MESEYVVSRCFSGFLVISGIFGSLGAEAVSEISGVLLISWIISSVDFISEFSFGDSESKLKMDSGV